MGEASTCGKALLRVFDPAPTYATGRRNERIASG
jgi:hypothetical protein